MALRLKILNLLVVCVVVIAGCTEPRETTVVGATTGGALGAGLGAIIGSTSGNAGAGLAIGATAGAATGAALGNVFQAQEEALRSQDEAIERQEQLIASQRKELDELRRLGQDSVSFSSRKVGNVGAKPYASRPTAERQLASNEDRLAASSMSRPAKTEYRSVGNTRETRIVERDVAVEARPPLDEKSWGLNGSRAGELQGQNLSATGTINRGDSDNGALNSRTALNNETGSLPQGAIENGIDSQRGSFGSAPTIRQVPLTAECRQASDEVAKADSAAQVSDRLFHMRRALRLCPDNSDYHAKLGSIYVALGRKIDAEFELEQALSINSNNLMARQQLDDLRQVQR